MLPGVHNLHWLRTAVLVYYGSTEEGYLNYIRDSTLREVVLEFNFERQDGIRWTKSNEVEKSELMKGWQRETA